jgi:hypothetical protein|tara:strand:- start:409 stop:732 length:324 start_codon:yes stop_codon:yes gene_type:complete
MSWFARKRNSAMRWLGRKVDSAKRVGRKIGNIADRGTQILDKAKKLPIVGGFISNKLKPYENKIRKGLQVGRKIGQVSNMSNEDIAKTGGKIALQMGKRYAKKKGYL